MNIEIANRLYTLRKKYGFSQEELAEKIGVSRQAVSKWERSESSPDTENLLALSKIYGVTIDEMLNKDIEESHVFEETSDDTGKASFTIDAEFSNDNSHTENNDASFLKGNFACSLNVLIYNPNFSVSI